MKNLSFLFITTLLILTGFAANSQNVIRQSGCADSFLLYQANKIKLDLSRQGFMVVKEASMTMESENEIPVIIPLTQGTGYQFIFIGDITSKQYEVRMFDWNEKQVAYQKKQGSELDGNVISYYYTPLISEYHMMKPIQVNMNKTKKLCGYVMLLKKVQ